MKFFIAELVQLSSSDFDSNYLGTTSQVYVYFYNTKFTVDLSPVLSCNPNLTVNYTFKQHGTKSFRSIIAIQARKTNIN